MGYDTNTQGVVWLVTVHVLERPWALVCLTIFLLCVWAWNYDTNRNK